LGEDQNFLSVRPNNLLGTYRQCKMVNSKFYKFLPSADRMIQEPSREYRMFLKRFERDSLCHRDYDNTVSPNVNVEISTRFFCFLFHFKSSAISFIFRILMCNYLFSNENKQLSPMMSRTAIGHISKILPSSLNVTASVPIIFAFNIIYPSRFFRQLSQGKCVTCYLTCHSHVSSSLRLPTLHYPDNDRSHAQFTKLLLPRRITFI